MVDPNHDESLATKTLSGIEVLLSSFAAQKDAHEFALDAIYSNTDELTKRIEQAKSLPNSITVRSSHLPLENLQMKVYLKEYLASLTHLTGMILKEQGSLGYSQKRLSSTLRRLVYEFDGMCDACVFALEENATLVNLKSKLTWSENFVIKSLTENPQGNMSPLNATRQCRDGYNIGLRECIEKIESILAEHGQ